MSECIADEFHRCRWPAAASGPGYGFRSGREKLRALEIDGERGRERERERERERLKGRSDSQPQCKWPDWQHHRLGAYFIRLCAPVDGWPCWPERSGAPTRQAAAAQKLRRMAGGSGTHALAAEALSLCGTGCGTVQREGDSAHESGSIGSINQGR